MSNTFLKPTLRWAWLLCVAPLCAQEDTRPDLSVREPERAARAEAFVLSKNRNPEATAPAPQPQRQNPPPAPP